MSWCAHILKSSRKQWYYVGSTNRIKERVKEHNTKKVSSTKYYIPSELVFLRKFNSESDVRAYEQKIKRKRIEKERIIKEIESKN